MGTRMSESNNGNIHPMERSIQQLLRHFIKKQKWHAVGGATGNASRLPNPVVTMDFVQDNFMTIQQSGPKWWTACLP